jgi:MYXO-CTERM domain-containing protein
MEGGKAPKEKLREDEIGDSDKVVLRRYEFYEYIGAVNEDNEPISVWEDVGNPLDPRLDVFDDQGNLIFAAECGDFISSNMVAAVLNPIPEPTAWITMAAGLGLLPFLRRRRQA